MQNQALKIALTLLMNTASALVGFAAFKQGSVGYIICVVAATAVGNTLALFGTPMVAKPIGDEESPKAKILPGEISKFAFLPILFAGAMLISGCGTAGGKAFTACELGKLPAIGQTAFATAHDIADNQSSTAADLTAAALALAPGQFDCAAKALLAWLEGLADPPAVEGAPVQRALLAASTSSFHDHARAVLREYLRGKSTSCRDIYSASR